jgi:hypothetical protein
VFFRDAFSDERSGLSIASQSLQYVVVCKYLRKNLYFMHLTYKVMYIQYIRGLDQSGLSAAIYALLIAVHAATSV